MAELERIIMRKPKSKRERLVAAINSSDADLYPHNGLVIITGKNMRGEIIELGSISEIAFYDAGINPRILLDKVRFGL